MAGDPDPFVCKLKCPLGNLATKFAYRTKRSGGIVMWCPSPVPCAKKFLFVPHNVADP